MSSQKKARAPRPKTNTPEERADKAKATKTWVQVTVGETGIVYKWNFAAIPVRARAEVARLHGGKAPEDVVAGRLSVLTFADLWWISRLIDEEEVDGRLITREQVHREWDEKARMVVLSEITDEECDPPEAFAQLS